MDEIRYCKLRDNNVIISSKRMHRPTEFNTAKDIYSIDECPFEKGKETATKSEIFRLSDSNGNWLTRVVPNLYNALDIHIDNSSKREGFFTKKSAFGAHEIIIETPHHTQNMNKYRLEQFDTYIKTIIHRISDLKNDTRLKHIQVFKNHGSKAGATLRHPHTQIIATGFIPKEIKREFKRCKKYFKKHKRTLLHDLLSEELRENKRVIVETNYFVAFAPYASLYSFEIFIVPKIDISCITELNNQKISDLSHILKDIYIKLYKVLGDFDFNLLFKNSLKNSKHFTFYVQIIPRIYMLAGYELSTNTRINPITPEMVTKKLKEAT